MSKIDIGGLKIDAISKKDFLAATLQRVKAGQKTFVTTPYSEFLYHGFQDSKILEIFNAADFAVADGIGIFWAKRYLEIPLTAKSYYGKIWQCLWQLIYSLAAIILYPSWIKSSLPEKIVGADLIWDLSDVAAKNNFSIYLLGGFNNTAELAAKQIQMRSYFHDRENMNAKEIKIFTSNKNPNDKSVVEDINNVKPDLLFVAYGPVKQEKWIYENLSQLDVKLAIGVGGTFDYIAGKKSQPPKFIRYGGLEWLWRLITQPYRIKRIFNATFGLMSGLWHYKVFQSLPMRKNVVVVILDPDNKILICQRNPKYFETITTKHPETTNYWQLPQGGMDENENIIEAAKRELREETGIVNVNFIYQSKNKYSYIWNNALRTFWRLGKRNKGQTQTIIYFRFSGDNNEIKVDQEEFINWQWVGVSELENVIHSDRAGLTQLVVEDLKEIL